MSFNFITRQLNSNSYITQKGFYYPKLCNQNITPFITGCQNTNKKITSITVDVQIQYTSSFGIVHTTTFSNIELKLYYYDSVQYITVLKSDVQHYSRTRQSTHYNTSTSNNAICQNSPCSVGVLPRCSYFYYRDRVIYTSDVSMAFDFSVIAISCNKETYTLYIMCDSFIDTFGGYIIPPSRANFIIACPTVENGFYPIFKLMLGLDTSQVYCFDQPQITNITVNQA